MHGLAVYVKDGIPFARDLSRKNSADSDFCFRLALLHTVSYFFLLYQSPSSSLSMVFDFISSNIDEVLSTNPSANVFVFDDFSVSNDLAQIVNFPTRIPDCDSYTAALSYLFISSNSSICSTMVFHPLGTFDHVGVSISIYFPINSKQDAPFHRVAYDYSRVD